MAYSTSTDIQSEFRDITFSASGTSINTTEVTEFIDQEDAYIDAKLRNRYTVPITNLNDLKVLKLISIALVAYRVANILNLKREVPLPDGRVAQFLNYTASYKKALKLLDQIFDGDLPLETAPITSGSGFSSYNQTNSIGPIFERDTDQW